MAPRLSEQRVEDAGKATLILDLDETLVSVPAYISYDDDPTERLTKRPGVDKFLRDMSTVYELVVFSASEEIYVDSVVRQLDPQGNMVAATFSKDDLDWQGKNVKDLRALGRDLSRVVWLDDNKASYESTTPLNGIEVPPFHAGNDEDRVLEQLTPLLLHLATVGDVRMELANNPVYV